jgi:hypothetical protein
MEGHHDLDPGEALARVTELSQRAGRRAQWPGWLFVTIAAINATLFVAMGSGDRTVSRALGAVPLLLLVAVVMFAARQPVIGRSSRRINRPVLVAAIATNVAGLIVYQAVLPQHFTGWLVVLAVAMQSPLLAGAWLWLRR